MDPGGLKCSGAMGGILTVQTQAQLPSKQVESLPEDASVLHFMNVKGLPWPQLLMQGSNLKEVLASSV